MKFEASRPFDDWPKNVAGKKTRVLVIGAMTKDGKRCCDLLWHGEFPDLEPAIYWGLKKERELIRRSSPYMAASRCVWQHDITVEQAMERMKQVTMDEDPAEDILGQAIMEAARDMGITPEEVMDEVRARPPEGGPFSGPKFIPNDPRE